MQSTKFPTADLLFTLHEIEQQLIKLGNGVLEEQRFSQSSGFKCREMGRAHGFFASARIIADKINRLGR